MWSPIYHGIKVTTLLSLLDDVRAEHPETVVVPNRVANLAILRPDKEEGWLFIGYIDLNNESVHWMEDDSIRPWPVGTPEALPLARAPA